LLTKRFAVLLFIVVLGFVSEAATQSQPTPAPAVHTIRVDATPGHATNSFVPTQTLGAGIDRLPAGAIDKLINPATMSKVLSAGWQPVSYRQNTELFVEAWHWNPQGTWSDQSDPAAGKGYFTGSPTSTELIQHSYGYPLPHRGFTRNDGTGSDGYSRMTDGDLNSYWKSNPYLSKAFTGEDDALHPQWVILDLANAQQINAIRIAWAEPYARRYVVQYWTGDDPIKRPTQGVWQAFPSGAVNDGHGGDATLQLVSVPIPVRFLRVLMTESSMSILNRVVDERFLTHRRKSTSTAGVIGGGLTAIGLFAWRYYINHVWSWDLFAVALTFVAVKMALMAWYLRSKGIEFQEETERSATVLLTGKCLVFYVWLDSDKF